MHPIWKQALETIYKVAVKSLSPAEREKLLYKTLPQLFLELMTKYFRLEVEGLEHIPRHGPGLITPNHSGYSGLDAMILSHEIRKGTGRAAKVLTHAFWFLSPITSTPAKKLGFVEATTANGLSCLKKRRLVILFPEGEQGNFKPSTKAYRLQEFKRGFVRMALATQSPIVPTLVLGAEESHINLSQLKLEGVFPASVLPLPLNLVPLPAKWKIRFLEPVYLPFKPEAVNDRELVHEIAEDIRERMQKALNDELSRRDSVFF